MRGKKSSEGEIMYFISQLGKQDCAFACLKMMLANYHHDKSYLYLPDEGDKGYSFTDLVNIASHHNMTLLGVKIDQPEELFKSKCFPIIVSLQKKKNVRHCVLVLRADTRHILVFDPAVGKRKINTELFFKEWNSKALIVKEFTPTKCQTIFPDFIAKKDKIILPIFQLLSGVSLLVGTFFMSENQRFYLPIIFFSLFIIFELLFRFQLLQAMKRMDDLIFDYSFRDDNTNYVELYQTIERYRTIALSITPNFIYASLVTMFITIILVMNGPINLVYIFVPLALGLIETSLYNPFYKSKEIEIGEKEAEINEVENEFQFKSKSNEVHKSAYQLGFNKNVFVYLEIGILLLTVILSMVISRSSNITYGVFYLCISFYLKSNFTKILEYSSQSDEFVMMKAKLINYLNLESNNS